MVSHTAAICRRPPLMAVDNRTCSVVGSSGTGGHLPLASRRSRFLLYCYVDFKQRMHYAFDAQERSAATITSMDRRFQMAACTTVQLWDIKREQNFMQRLESFIIFLQLNQSPRAAGRLRFDKRNANFAMSKEQSLNIQVTSP